MQGKDGGKKAEEEEIIDIRSENFKTEAVNGMIKHWQVYHYKRKM